MGETLDRGVARSASTLSYHLKLQLVCKSVVGRDIPLPMDEAKYSFVTMKVYG